MMSAVRRRLKGRPDSEHEMTINRIVLSTVVLAYLVIAQSKGHDAAQDVFHDALVLFGGARADRSVLDALWRLDHHAGYRW
jgi:hypothetical protein